MQIGELDEEFARLGDILYSRIYTFLLASGVLLCSVCHWALFCHLAFILDVKGKVYESLTCKIAIKKATLSYCQITLSCVMMAGVWEGLDPNSLHTPRPG